MAIQNMEGAFMPKFKLDPTSETIAIEHVEYNEKIGRVSIDGQVDGKYVAVVFMESDIPNSCNSIQKQREFIKGLMKAQAGEQEDDKSRPHTNRA